MVLELHTMSKMVFLSLIGAVVETAVSMLTPVSALCVVGFYYYGKHFIPSIERREHTVQFEDAILSRFKPVDCTIVNVVLFNTSAVCIVVETIMNGTFRYTMYAHALTMLVRMVTLYLLPLREPTFSIPLRDPIIDWFTGTQSKPLMKDLFMSGHTLFVWVNLFWTREIIMHSMFAVLIPVLLLWQHVHYTVDVIMAPFVAYTCSNLVKMIVAS